MSDEHATPAQGMSLPARELPLAVLPEEDNDASSGGSYSYVGSSEPKLEPETQFAPEPEPETKQETKQEKKAAEKERKALEKATKAAEKEWTKEQKKLQKVWNKADADGSGSLDAAEVRKVMGDMGQKNMSEEAFGAAMSEMDGDGSGEVDYGEFVEWWKKQDPERQKLLSSADPEPEPEPQLEPEPEPEPEPNIQSAGKV